MASTGPHKISINGHNVSLFTRDDPRFPEDAKATDWIIVKFDHFIQFHEKLRLRQKIGLKIYERFLGNAYLAKYESTDLSLLNTILGLTHIALFPNYAVPVHGLLSTEGIDEARISVADHANADSSVSQDANEARNTIQGYHDRDDSTNQHESKLNLLIALHPEPSLSPQQVLDELLRMGAEHLDDQIHPKFSQIRVRVARHKIPAIASIDSIRTIEKPFLCRPCSIVDRDLAGVCHNALSNEDASKLHATVC